MAELFTHWEETQDGIRIEWKLGILPMALRYAIGVPILGVGILFFVLIVVNIAMFIGGKGADLIVGTLVVVVLTAVLLPLGWWIVMSRSYLVIRSDGKSVLEVVDWRVGRKVTEHPTTDYAALRISVEKLNEETNSPRRRHATVGIRVALEPHSPTNTPWLELGWFDESTERIADARVFAKAVSTKLGLQLCDELDEWYGRG